MKCVINNGWRSSDDNFHVEMLRMKNNKQMKLTVLNSVY